MAITVPALVTSISATWPASRNCGRTSWGTVEIEWDANTERDIIGYDVRRSDGTVVCPLATQQLKTFCTDTSPPAGPLSYWVRAYDKTPGTGVPRAGADSDRLDVAVDNNAPFSPIITAYSRSGDVTTIKWLKATPIADIDGDPIAFYRIYRDGTAITNRYERWYDSSSSITWQDTQTGGTTHTYYITAVDSHYAESPMVGPVTQ